MVPSIENVWLAAVRDLGSEREEGRVDSVVRVPIDQPYEACRRTRRLNRGEQVRNE